MSATMKAAILKGPHTVALEEIPRPTMTEPTDVVIKVERTAICGTDLHPYENRLELEDDVVLGHEFLGTIIEAGSGVARFSEGDRVVASCVVSCGGCHSCRRGDPGRCAGVRIFGMGITFGDLVGGQAEYVLVPNADTTLKAIPEGVGDDDMLFVGDIITTGYEAVRRSIRPGDSVAIVGAGPVGLCAAMSAQLLGAAQVFVVDKVPVRLKEAEQYGAIPINFDDDDPQDVVYDHTDWRGADLVIDAVGHESALISATRLVANSGTISIPGAYVEESIALPFGELWVKGITIQGGVANIVNYMDEVTTLIMAGKLRPSQLISHRMGLSEVSEAYRMFHAHEATKIVLDPTR
ncbi:MAG: alcohol dehydrogenase catalytic domain-containing protein [Nocardioidaceae bacterium]|nr:alcohol dehydrogenase catalytic domain-containing protein [Nocardioidaceae bacterium]